MEVYENEMEWLRMLLDNAENSDEEVDSILEKQIYFMI